MIRVNGEALWQVLRMYDVGGKLLSGIKSMYVDSSACVRIKRGESEWFRIDSGGETGISCPLAVQCNLYKRWGDEGDEYGDGKEGSEIPGGWEKVEIGWSLVCR